MPNNHHTPSAAELLALRRDVAGIISSLDAHTLPEGDASILEAGRRIPVLRKLTKELYKKYEHLIQGDIETNEVTDKGVMPLQHRLEDVLRSRLPDSLGAATSQMIYAYYLDLELDGDVIDRTLELIEREGGPPIDLNGLLGAESRPR